MLTLVQRDRQIAAMCGEYSTEEIAAGLGVSAATVCYRTRFMGIQAAHPSGRMLGERSEEANERIYEMVVGGQMKTADIASMVGMTRNAVIKRIHLMGLRSVTPWPTHRTRVTSVLDDGEGE